MADLEKMDRTWLCSVLFMDIANYSSQSVELQMKWKKRFNGYLSEAIREIPESERVILDTGDGAAVCFLGAPEAPMFAALELNRAFAVDEREQKPGLRVRLGINLGPVKLVRDINGALNAIGDGINAGQRIMSFASDNQILVSQSFYEVVSRLSDDYKQMFHLKGVETDKHVREHTVYQLTPPRSEVRAQIPLQRERAIADTASSSVKQATQAAKGSRIPWLIAGAAVAALAAVGVAHFRGESGSPLATPAAPAAATGAATPGASTAAPTIPAPTPAAAPIPAPTDPVTANPPSSASRPTNSKPALSPPATTVSSAIVPPTSTPTPSPGPTPPSAEAKADYEEGLDLINEEKPAEAVHYFDEAIR